MAENDGIGVALIGYGLAGRVFHAPLIQSASALSLRTICSSRTQEIAALGQGIRPVADPATAIEDPAIDLVVVATPSATHFDLARRALLAGKHVVVDKPVVSSAAQARELVSLSHRMDRRLFAFHNRRWDSDFLSVAKAIKANDIGRITHFESHFDRFRPEIRDRWREDGSAGSGVWQDLGPHLVDQALALFGAPRSVTADIACLRDGALSDDWAHVILHYPAMRVILHASLNSPDGASGGHPRFRVHGTQGSLVKRRLDPQEAQLAVGLRPGDAGWGVDDDPLEIYRTDGGPALRAAERGCQEAFYTLVGRRLSAEAANDAADMASMTLVSNDALVLVYHIMEAALRASQERRAIDIML